MSRIALLVDDEEDIASLFQRILKRTFDQVLVAGPAEQAEAALASKPVTHLVCDAFLGTAEPQGTAGRPLAPRPPRHPLRSRLHRPRRRAAPGRGRRRLLHQALGVRSADRAAQLRGLSAAGRPALAARRGLEM